jgi:RNA polymerase sigma-70 factor (ECF subfamily)
VDALCRYAALITKSPDAAEEIVQDVLFEIWRRRHELVITSGLRHYLYGAVRNRALNVVRQGQRHARLQSAVEREAAIAADLADGLDPDTRVRALEIDAALRRAVDQLPPRCRAAYQHRAAGLSYAEIASRLGVAVKTVEAHVTTAIKVLRRRLARFR